MQPDIEQELSEETESQIDIEYIHSKHIEPAQFKPVQKKNYDNFYSEEEEEEDEQEDIEVADDEESLLIEEVDDLELDKGLILDTNHKK